MKHVKFHATSAEANLLVPRPKPASQYMPTWANHRPAGNRVTNLISNNGPYGVSYCVPFHDAMQFGYIQELWTDLALEHTDDGQVRWFYPENPPVLEARPQPSVPEPVGYVDVEMVWKVQWLPQVPNGYSVLIQHPANRIDLPFTTLSGVIDSDSFFSTNSGNLPFYVKSGFTGVIPAGTPLFQIIPFKRDNWDSSEQTFVGDEFRKATHKNRRYVFDGYKKNHWSRKIFK